MKYLYDFFGMVAFIMLLIAFLKSEIPIVVFFGMIVLIVLIVRVVKYFKK